MMRIKRDSPVNIKPEDVARNITLKKKFRIHYSGDYEDSFIIEADTIEEIRKGAHEECARRGWDEAKCWSEELR